jgi:hypothetical protein
MLGDFVGGDHMGQYRKRLCLSIVSTAMLILLAIPVVAQLPTATILGVAKDTSGGVLPIATVTATNLDTGLTRTVKTGDDGTYRIPELPVGRYEVKGEHAGFKTETRKGITLEVTDQAVINLTFEVGSAEQQVIVTEEASIVNTQNATLGGLVNEQNIETLPLNGRNYVDLSLLHPRSRHILQRQRSPAAVQQFHSGRRHPTEQHRPQPCRWRLRRLPGRGRDQGI